jgi:hypothetical protein
MINGSHLTNQTKPYHTFYPHRRIFPISHPFPAPLVLRPDSVAPPASCGLPQRPNAPCRIWGLCRRWVAGPTSIAQWRRLVSHLPDLHQGVGGGGSRIRNQTLVAAFAELGGGGGSIAGWPCSPAEWWNRAQLRTVLCWELHSCWALRIQLPRPCTRADRRYTPPWIWSASPFDFDLILILHTCSFHPCASSLCCSYGKKQVLPSKSLIVCDGSLCCPMEKGSKDATQMATSVLTPENDSIYWWNIEYVVVCSSFFGVRSQGSEAWNYFAISNNQKGFGVPTGKFLFSNFSQHRVWTTLKTMMIFCPLGVEKYEMSLAIEVFCPWLKNDS